jgi:proteasome lid subunit RPN8/RPN11
MLPLLLHAEHDAAIREHARRAFPHECCGFLLGRDADGERRVVEVLAAENEREAVEPEFETSG